jgi:hypothetical protein
MLSEAILDIDRIPYGHAKSQYLPSHNHTMFELLQFFNKFLEPDTLSQQNWDHKLKEVVEKSTSLN